MRSKRSSVLLRVASRSGASMRRLRIPNRTVAGYSSLGRKHVGDGIKITNRVREGERETAFGRGRGREAIQRCASVSNELHWATLCFCFSNSRYYWKVIRSSGHHFLSSIHLPPHFPIKTSAGDQIGGQLLRLIVEFQSRLCACIGGKTPSRT
jgi:hypothetical protein